MARSESRLSIFREPLFHIGSEPPAGDMFLREYALPTPSEQRGPIDSDDPDDITRGHPLIEMGESIQDRTLRRSCSRRRRMGAFRWHHEQEWQLHRTDLSSIVSPLERVAASPPRRISAVGLWGGFRSRTDAVAAWASRYARGWGRGAHSAPTTLAQSFTRPVPQVATSKRSFLAVRLVRFYTRACCRLAVAQRSVSKLAL
jgi:hypothetical protein